MKVSRSYLIKAVLACVVFYYALDMSRGGRGVVDWVVLSAVGLAVLYNLWQLGRRLHRFGGSRALWHEQRTVLFWIIGLFNTVLARPEAAPWKGILGGVLLAVAFGDTIALYRRERAAIRTPPQTPEGM